MNKITQLVKEFIGANIHQPRLQTDFMMYGMEQGNETVHLFTLDNFYRSLAQSMSASETILKERQIPLELVKNLQESFREGQTVYREAILRLGTKRHDDYVIFDDTHRRCDFVTSNDFNRIRDCILEFEHSLALHDKIKELLMSARHLNFDDEIERNTVRKLQRYQLPISRVPLGVAEQLGEVYDYLTFEKVNETLKHLSERGFINDNKK